MSTPAISAPGTATLSSSHFAVFNCKAFAVGIVCTIDIMVLKSMIVHKFKLLSAQLNCITNYKY